MSEKLMFGRTNFISVYADQGGAIWAGTYGEGVYRINPNNLEYKLFNNDDGLEDNNVISISGSKDLVWFSTLGGGVFMLQHR